jgi:hypothetical protein
VAWEIQRAHSQLHVHATGCLAVYL